MSMPPHLSIVTLGVADLARSIGFYRALGWHQAESSVDGVISWFAVGGTWLGLFPTPDLAEDAGFDRGSGPQPGAFIGVTLAVNVGGEAEVDDALAAAVAAGGTLQVPAVMTDFGIYRGYVADPDGHLWEVAHNPDFPLRADGGIDIP
jgi:catechol 2,3-dioxygenase-like lactoylglutathione lyase family enzyme